MFSEVDQLLTLPDFLHSLATEVGKGLLMPKGMASVFLFFFLFLFLFLKAVQENKGKKYSSDAERDS